MSGAEETCLSDVWLGVVEGVSRELVVGPRGDGGVGVVDHAKPLGRTLVGSDREELLVTCYHQPDKVCRDVVALHQNLGVLGL